MNAEAPANAGTERRLPEHWRWASVGETGSFINGVASKPTDWGKEGLPIIRIQNLTDPNRPLNRTTRKVDPVYRIQTGDMLVSWSATLDAFLWDREPSLLNQHIFKVVPNESVVRKRFLYYLLKFAIREMFRSEHLHGSTMKHINRGPFLAHRIPLAPLEEQDRIVTEIEKQFTRLDAGVAALRSAQAKLKRYRAAVLKAACDGPWPRTTVAKIAADVRYGTSAKTSESPHGVPVLRMGNIVDGRLSLAKLKFLPNNHPEFPDLLLKSGDVLFNRTNSAELVGKTAVYHGTREPCSFASYLIRVRLGDEYSPNFLSYYLNSTYGRAWIASVVSQQVGQANVNGTKLKALEIPNPPLAEQTRIVADVERKLSVAEELEAVVNANLQRATRLTQSILHKAFEGKLSSLPQ